MKHWIIWMLLALYAVCGGTSCSSEKPKKSSDDFLEKLEKDSRKIASKAKQKREREKADRKQREEKHKRKIAEESKKVKEAHSEMLNRQSQPAPPDSVKGAPEQDVQYDMSEQDIKLFKRLILSKIQEASDGAPISMSFENGEVTLFGIVKSAATRQKVIRTLKNIQGIRRVNAEQLVVESK